MRTLLFISALSAICLSACSAVDRAGIVCSQNESFSASPELLSDCEAGTHIADQVAMEFAKKHRLLPLVSIPDNDELAGAKAEAYSRCAELSDNGFNAQDPTLRQLACEYGLQAYVRQIQFYNARVGQ